MYQFYLFGYWRFSNAFRKNIQLWTVKNRIIWQKLKINVCFGGIIWNKNFRVQKKKLIKFLVEFKNVSKSKKMNETCPKNKKNKNIHYYAKYNFTTSFVYAWDEFVLYSFCYFCDMFSALSDNKQQH